MFKRLMIILLLVCLGPMAAYAASWTLNTWARSGGGTIVVRGGTPQTSANGSVFKSYTTSQAFTVTVNPNTGYIVSQVNYNNVTTTSPSQTSYTVQGPTSQLVYANFSPLPLTVTASVSIPGGSVSPTALTGIVYGAKLTTARTFTFTPSPATYSVASITGVPAGATVSSALPAAVNIPVTVTLPVGFTFTSDIALYGTFSGPPIAKTGPPQVVIPGTPTTLDGSSSIGAISSYTWTQTAGPGFPLTKVIIDNTPGATVTFTPTVVGLYTFRLTVTGGSTAIATVNVTDNYPEFARAQCYNCHSAAGVGVTSNVFGNWSSSGHKTKAVMCAKCHVGADTGGHPSHITGGSVSEITFDFAPTHGTGNYCITCHDPAIITDFAASKHSIVAGTASCSFCHVKGVHNPSADCTNCHKVGNTLGLPWPPTGYTFHSSFTDGSVCKMCHTLHNPKVLSFGGSCK